LQRVGGDTGEMFRLRQSWLRRKFRGKIAHLGVGDDGKGRDQSGQEKPKASAQPQGGHTAGRKCGTCQTKKSCNALEGRADTVLSSLRTTPHLVADRTSQIARSEFEVICVRL